MAERTDLPKRGIFGSVKSLSYSEDFFIFRHSNDVSIIIPVLGGASVAIDKALNEQVSLLNQMLIEEKKIVLHLADGSDEDIDDDSVESE